ncbi:MAG TPA: DUF5681 domain-containing protein [Terriglobales bacterium]
MADSSDNLSSTAGRYDKLLEAGKATRFVKGKSGNPAGRPKKSQSTADLQKYLEHLRAFLTRA